jgi:chromosome partitioning protein
LYIIAAVRTIAVINQKGGVGKTTTVANLGSALSAMGLRVGLIDLDPQAHLTLHVGIEPGQPAVGMYEVLTAEAPMMEAMIEVSPGLWAAGSSIDLAAAEVELVGTVGREQILCDRLAAGLPFDVVMIDCPPSLGLLTLNALAAADEVLIPLQPHFLALQGLGKLLETVALVQRRINPRLKVAGVVLCLWETNTKLSAEVLADLRQFLAAGRDANAPWSGARIFESVIRRNIKLAECPSYGKTIFQYEPASRGAEDHVALAREFAAALGLAPQAALPAAQAPADAAAPAAEAPPPAPPAAPADAPPAPPSA